MATAEFKKVDCTACGRTAVTYEDSYDVCNRVHCPAYEWHRKREPKSFYIRALEWLVARLEDLK